MMVLANVLLAMAWLALVGPVTISNFLVGMLLGFVALVVAAPAGRIYARRVMHAAGLAFHFWWSLLVANINVAAAVIRSPKRLRPLVIDVPLEDLSDVELAILASLITLTPGTVALDVTADRKHMLVHVLHAEDAAAAIRDVKEGFEARLLLVTRGERPAQDPPGAQDGAPPR
ncbi:MAG TPA: Na+/H+ antiporter subunit E [Phycisphaerales bacterium]|nr:Na+/H+ antiporter subunit E [Phycisphaerales bacterium]HMP36897.1 Na+/H+ antiporter subunit E [Phycisphaerales bacterium]